VKLSAAVPVKFIKPLYSEVKTMKKWTVVGILGICLFGICLGSVVAVVPVINQALSGKIQWNIFSAQNISADAVEEHRAAVDGPADLKVTTPFGKVDIAAKAGSHEIVVSAHKSAWGGTK
jgi:hypothetical protein